MGHPRGIPGDPPEAFVEEFYDFNVFWWKTVFGLKRAAVGALGLFL